MSAQTRIPKVFFLPLGGVSAASHLRVKSMAPLWAMELTLEIDRLAGGAQFLDALFEVVGKRAGPQEVHCAA